MFWRTQRDNHGIKIMRLLRGGPITTPAEPATISEWLQGHRHDGRPLLLWKVNAHRHRRGLPWLHRAESKGIGERLANELQARGVVLTGQLMATLVWLDGTHPSHLWRDRGRIVDHLHRHSIRHGWTLKEPRLMLASIVMKSTRDEARHQKIDHTVIHDPEPARLAKLAADRAAAAHRRKTTR